MAKSTNLLREVAADSTIAIGFKVVAVPLMYAINLIMARLYGAEHVGNYFICINLLILLSTFCNLGLHQGLLYFAAGLKATGKLGALRRVFRQAAVIAFILSLMVAAGLYASRHFLAAHFHSPTLPGMLLFFGLALPIFVSCYLFGETVRGLGEVRRVIFQESLLLPLGFLIVMMVLFYSGGKVIGPSRVLGLAYLSSTLISLMFLAAILWCNLRKEPRGNGQFSLMELLTYSWPLLLTAIVGLSMKSFDSLILGIFTSPADVAYYGIAIRTAGLIIFPLMAVNSVVPPLFAKFHALSDLGNLEVVAQATARWMYFLSLPLTIMIILIAPELLKFFGPDFTKGEFALRALAIGQFTNAATGSVGIILAMSGNQKTLILVQGVVGLCSLPLMVLGAAYSGLNGLALAVGLGLAALNILQALAVWRRLKIKAFANRVWGANLAGLFGVGLFYLSQPYVGPLWAAGLFGLTYLAMMTSKIREELTGVRRYRLMEA
jgi:O-antigen/teichoic acid export membrane protein